MPFTLERVKAHGTICGIELAFTGQLLPSTIEGYQPFANSIPAGTDFQAAYAGKASINFDEESDDTKAGVVYKQKLVIRFPTTDSSRSERIALMHKVKFVKVMLSNNKHFVLGRNDFEQNARMKIKVKADEHLGQVEFESTSIFPSGYTPAFNAAGLPVLFPINFLNEE